MIDISQLEDVSKKIDDCVCIGCVGLKRWGDSPYCNIKKKLLLRDFPPKKCDFRKEGVK